jgi:hypothetical protein
MKRFLSYGLPVAVLIFHIAVINAHVPEKGDTGSATEESCFYLMPDAPPVPVGLNSEPGSRVPVFSLKTVNNPYSTLKSCFSNLTHQQIHIIRSVFFLHYSKKEKDGYYIYALRKLLI